MISITRITAAAAVAVVTAACASIQEMRLGAAAQAPSTAAAPESSPPSVDLLANGLGGFVEVGGAHWSFGDGVAVATSGDGVGFLLTPDDYADFELTVEFFVSEQHNSGVFFRCSDRADITDVSCYEANIYDTRPDQRGRTGGIPNYAPPEVAIDAAGRWNTYVIRAQGDHITITLNGQTTVDTRDSTHASGPLGLQWGAGTVMFRNMRVRRL